MSPRIVIVDDTITLGRNLKTAILTVDQNYTVVVVPSAEEAMLELGLYQVDLVVTDIRLPGISGIDLIQWMRVRSPATKAILMSGIESYPLEQMAQDVGALAAFKKPFDTAQFLEKIREVLQMPGAASAGQAVTTAGKETEAPPKEQTIPDVLAELCQQIEAKSVVLLDENARIFAQAGALLPEWFESTWSIPLMGSVNAGSRFSMMVGGREPCSAYFFSGNERAVLAATVGDFVFAALWYEPGGKDLCSPQSFALFLQAREKLIQNLGQLGVRLVALPAVEPSIEAPSAAVQESLMETDFAPIDPELLSTIFSQKQPECSPETADEFWSSVVENTTDIKINLPDVLSFDQAQQLGLAPEDDSD